MEQAGPVNRDEFYCGIMWMIPQRFAGEDLFSGKFGGKVWIHSEKNKMVGQTKFDNSELMLLYLVLFISF